MSTGDATEGVGRLASSVLARLHRDHALAKPGRTVIGIAGESGSGKTVLASAVARALSLGARSAVVLHQDDYFDLPPRANHDHRCLDLTHVGPHEVNLDLLRSHIAAFRAGERVTVPRADAPSDSFLPIQIDFGDVDMLIVEGTYVLQLAELDIRIFLAATHDETRERRVQRNRDVYAPVIDRILAIEHEIIVRQAAVADLVIDREFAVLENMLPTNRPKH